VAVMCTVNSPHPHLQRRLWSEMALS
jgi:hypothetical protein